MIVWKFFNIKSYKNMYHKIVLFLLKEFLLIYIPIYLNIKR